MRRRADGILLGTGMAMLLAACGGASPPPAATTAPAGEPSVERPHEPAVLEVRYETSVARGETLALDLRVYNGGETDVSLIPMAVVLAKGREIAEGYGKGFRLAPGGESSPVRVWVPTRRLAPGPYAMSVILLDGRTEKRVGTGRYHQTFEVR